MRAGDRALVDRDAADHLVGRVVEDIDPAGVVADQVEVVAELVEHDVGGGAAVQRDDIAEGGAGGLLRFCQPWTGGAKNQCRRTERVEKTPENPKVHVTHVSFPNAWTRQSSYSVT